MNTFKSCKIDGVFMGHFHEINASILYKGIRWTVGLKTGTYDSHIPEELGGTIIELSNDSADFSVKHIYIN